MIRGARKRKQTVKEHIGFKPQKKKERTRDDKETEEEKKRKAES